jgi:hypothetical protein
MGDCLHFAPVKVAADEFDRCYDDTGRPVNHIPVAAINVVVAVAALTIFIH